MSKPIGSYKTTVNLNLDELKKLLNLAATQTKQLHETLGKIDAIVQGRNEQNTAPAKADPVSWLFKQTTTARLGSMGFDEAEIDLIKRFVEKTSQTSNQ
ncbi:MAG: hypothetical protein LKJ69_01685 [Lactobacillus sp.]|jgi:hypothetical protein|nr:hypothetical protein [Lactobacillus sp.]MCI2032095.1 hypothetical protein [Lactobacillus sp.]